MAIFVLVHGAMHGGWCWRDVRGRLQAAGHEVYAPTLTGQGERRQSLSKQVGVTTHVTDIAELLWFDDLEEVHLVLHSYAGILAGPIAQREWERLASIVFLAAFVTRPGQCLLDVEPPDVGRRYRALARDTGEGWYVPPTDHFLDQWGITGDSMRALVRQRLTDFPLLCQTEPTLFDPLALDRVRKIYVNPNSPEMASLRPHFEAAVAAGWETYELPFGHDLMLAAPDATAEVLDGIARRSP